MLATVLVGGGAAGAMTTRGEAEDIQPTPTSMRAQVALQAAESALGLVKPARGWTRLASVPARERRLLGSVDSGNLSREETAKLETRTTLWVTRSTPRAILAYVHSRLPRDTKAQGEESSGTSHTRPGPPGPNTSAEVERNYRPDSWSQEFTLRPASDVLRHEAVVVSIARATDGRFVIRLEGRAVWLGIRPGYSLLGANIHTITVTNTFPVTRNVGPSTVVIANASLVHALVTLVNSIPPFEDKGAAFSCPSEKPQAEPRGVFVLTFAEQAGATPLATLEGQPYACGDSFLPTITVPGHPPLELEVEPALVTTINSIAGLRLPSG